MREKQTKAERVDAGSGDALVDLGFPDTEERKLRVQLAMRLNHLIPIYCLTQAHAAKLLGIERRHVSELKHYKLNRFTSEQLMHFLTLFGRDTRFPPPIR